MRNRKENITFLIIPIFEILNDHQESEQLFYFYDDGLRGVVRDIILFSSGCEFKNLHPNKRAGADECVVEKILRDYYNTPEATLSRFTDNIDMEVYIEVIAQSIAISVEELLRALIPRIVYEFSKTEFQWLGDDLLLKMRIFE